MTEVGTLRRRLGWLLLWALLPLPFLYIVLPPFWLLAAAAAIFLVLRPERLFNPSKTALNVIGAAILVAVLAAGGLNVGPLRPLGHLLLLLTAVRVMLVDDRRSFMRALAMVGMAWVVAVTDSTHMTAAVYFCVSAVIAWWVGMRVHLEGLGLGVDHADGPMPRASHVAAATCAALVIAVPVFLVMPRLGSPWVAGRNFSRTTGFSPTVDLGTMGRLTESQEVALVMRTPDGTEIDEASTRLRGTAFDLVMAGSWLPRRADLRPLEPSRGIAWLQPGHRELTGSVEIDIELLRPRRYLMVPPGAVAIQAQVPMYLDPYGGILIGSRSNDALNYRVWVGETRPPRAAPPGPRDTRLPRDDPEVREMALMIAGNLDSDEARARAVERYLQRGYRYSLESGVRIQTEDPVAWFLLQGGEGHCEFFAGAMVVLLRHLGVPARMVAGYSGGDISPDGDQVVVREANAHAWVEVWLGAKKGWATFDPTPPASVPGLGGVSGLERVRWTWQQLELLWDRRLLTFGFGEQIDLVDSLSDAAHRAGHVLRRPSVVIGAGAGTTAMVGIALLWRWWRRRRRRWRDVGRRGLGPAARAMTRLAWALIPVGGVNPPWATIRGIGRQAVAFWPQSAAAVDALVQRAEVELYGADGDRDVDRAEIRRLWKTIRRGMKSRELTVDGS